MRSIIVTMIVFGAIPLVFMRPWTGILLYSWISYMNPHRLTYGFAYNFEFALISALVTIAAFIIGPDKKQIPVTPITFLLILFILWTSITTITALAPDNAWEQYIKFLKIQIMTFLTLGMMTSRDRIKWLIVVIVVSLGYYGLRGGIFSILTGGNYRVYGPPGSFFEDNNQLALTLIMTMPFMHYLQLVYTKKWIRNGLSLLMLLTLAAIISTYSRGALLALSAMGFFLWLRSTRKFPIAFAAMICIIGVLSFMPQKWFDRMNTIDNYQQDKSAEGRLDSWLFAINVANDRLLGGGFKVNTRADLWPKYNPDAARPRAPHSIYFEVLGEHGWIGLFIFLCLAASAVLTCRRTQKLTRDRPDLKWANDLSRMMQVSLVGYATAGAFLNLATFDLYYHVLAIIVMTRVIAGQEIAKGVPMAVETSADEGDTADTGESQPERRGRGQPVTGQLSPGGASGFLIKRR